MAAGPNATPGTVHAAPTIADAEGHTAPVAAGGQSVTGVAVRPIVTSASPLEAQTVTASQLYEQGAAPDPAAPMSTGLTAIREIRGTVAAPMIEEAADPSLFINPGPKSSDVQQGGIGDCWDMATFVGIVNRDPNKIRSMMAPDGSGGATVSFFRRVVTPAPAPPAPAPGAPPPPPAPPVVSFAPEAVTVDNTLAFDRATAAPGAPPPAAGARAGRVLPDGTTYGFQLHGARLRAAPQPLKRFWWAELVGDVLEVHRRDVYQMARWAPILEKAHARFAEPFGQYGHSGQVAAEGEKSGGSGYQAISGGFPGYTMTMFYGSAGQYVAGGQGGVDVTTWQPNMATVALLTANSAAFDRLLLLGGRAGTFQPGDATAPVVTARALGGSFGEQQYFTRLQAMIPAARTSPDWPRYTAQARADINAVDTALTAWTNAIPDITPTPPGGQPPNAKTPTAQAVVQAAHRAVARSHAQPPAERGGASATTKALSDLLLVVKNMPVDWSQGSRSVYSGHEYSVLSVNIKDTSGAPLAIHSAAVGRRAHGDVRPRRRRRRADGEADEPAPHERARRDGEQARHRRRVQRLAAALLPPLRRRHVRDVQHDSARPARDRREPDGPRGGRPRRDSRRLLRGARRRAAGARRRPAAGRARPRRDRHPGLALARRRERHRPGGDRRHAARARRAVRAGGRRAGGRRAQRAPGGDRLRGRPADRGRRDGGRRRLAGRRHRPRPPAGRAGRAPPSSSSPRAAAARRPSSATSCSGTPVRRTR